MANKFADYRVKDGDPVDADFFNRRWRDVDARIGSLEDNVPEAEAVIADLRANGLARIEEAIGPNLERIQAAAELGFLLGPVADDYELTFALGQTAIPLLAGPQRDIYTPTPFVAIVRTSTANDYATARTLNWDRDTGVLTVDIQAVFGNPGPHSDLQVEPLVGGALAVTNAIAGVAVDRAAAQAAATAAQTASTAAQTARTGAQSAQSAAEVARSGAEAARDQAQAAANGGIRVVSGDTTPGLLDSKLAVSGAITKSVSQPSGNAVMTITARAATTSQTGVARLATTGEAQAGTAADIAVTPAGLAAAIAATGGSGGSSSVVRDARASNTALAAADRGKLIDFTASFTQTFAACSTLGSGWYAYLRNASGSDVVLDPSGSEQIDGLTSFTMYPGEARLVQCDGSALRSVVLAPFSKLFTSSGTFIRPPGYAAFDVETLGAGGGGAGGGTRVSGGEDVFAGAGGGGGAYFTRRLASTEINATEAVTVGAGGSGGAGRASGSGQVRGVAGGAGGASSFGAHLGAAGGFGGQPGAEGTDNGSVRTGVQTGAAGASALQGAAHPYAGGPATTGDSGSIAVPLWGGAGGGNASDWYWSGSAGPGGRSAMGGCGGGGGGGVDCFAGGSFSQAYNGAVGGGFWTFGAASTAGGGGSGTPGGSGSGGSAGGAGTTGANALRGTGGGGGGGGGTTGGVGGAGGRGSGGGGGGAGYNGAGAAGGAGGSGAVRVVGIA